MNLQRRLLWTSVVLIMAASAAAHHSFAMFDQSKETSLTGTVKSFQWTSPHCWIQLLVPIPGKANISEEWAIEMGNPGALYRVGWRPGSLKEGDKITVAIHPLRDGKKGGSFVSAIDAKGQHIGK